VTDDINSNLNLDAIERLLRAGLIQGCVDQRADRWWTVRRNGQTKLWKTRPGEFQIPVKAGLKTCGCITHHCIEGGVLRRPYRIAPTAAVNAKAELKYVNA
jgi:hypothetical protein